MGAYRLSGTRVSQGMETPRVVWAVSEVLLDTKGRKPTGVVGFVHATRNRPGLPSENCALAKIAAVALNLAHVATSCGLFKIKHAFLRLRNDQRVMRRPY